MSCLRDGLHEALSLGPEALKFKATAHLKLHIKIQKERAVVRYCRSNRHVLVIYALSIKRAGSLFRVIRPLEAMTR